MKHRRNFLKRCIAITTSFSLLPSRMLGTETKDKNIAAKLPTSKQQQKQKIVISTWSSGIAANKDAWKVLSNGGTSLDAVEKGVMNAEADEHNMTVGYGAFPDASGKITLDASIMDDKYNCGAVAFLENIKHPVCVARKVMEKTPHVMLAGDGAFDFAIKQGFKKENLVTKKSMQKWKEWKKNNKFKPIINIENHDTIGMLAMDDKGNLGGACTTSGLAYKLRGRVGDSPIIGSALYVDNNAGAVVCTGLGEAVIRTSLASVVIEMMRQGKDPNEACKMGIERVFQVHYQRKEFNDMQVGVISIDKNGNYGGYSLRKGFNFAVQSDTIDNILVDVDHLVD